MSETTCQHANSDRSPLTLTSVACCLRTPIAIVKARTENACLPSPRCTLNPRLLPSPCFQTNLSIRTTPPTRPGRPRAPCARNPYSKRGGRCACGQRRSDHSKVICTTFSNGLDNV
eukprot:6179329-Pleurochrysis_carterae.AAC.1